MVRTTILTATAILTIAGMTLARAQDDATLNHCWGDIASDVAGAGLMGEHSSADSPFTPDPGEGGRRGVGNVSKEDFGALADGGQGQHAITNGERLERIEDGEFACDDPLLGP